MKKSKGIFPDPTKGWRVLSDLGEWIIFSKPGGKPWINIKVVKKGYDNHKANFMLGWNGERFASSSDYDVLVERNPSLHKMVIAALEQ